MTSRLGISLFATLLLTAVACGAEFIDLGVRREPFVDDFLLESSPGLRLRLHQPVRQSEKITLDRPWEGNNSAYATVIKDGERYLFYYRGTGLTLKPGQVHGQHYATTCVMTSGDGLTWDRPSLGFVRRAGWEDNNIILTFDPDCKIDFAAGETLDDGNDVLSGKKVKFTGAVHNFTPFIDANPDCPPEQRFKALGGHDHRTLYAFSSPDGLQWSPMQSESVIKDGMMDSQNLAFWDPSQSCYVAYYRDFKNKKGDTRKYTKQQFSFQERDVRVATSQDFLHWTPGEWVEWLPERGTQLYTSQVQLYPGAPHIRIGFPMRYIPHRGLFSELNEKIAAASNYYGRVYTDTGLITSRDGRKFRVWPEALLRPGPGRENWFYGFGGTALNLFQTQSAPPGADPEWSFYVMDHGSWFGSGVSYQRYSIRQDGFVSLYASGAGGELVTKPLRFGGDQLTLNYATSAAGSIQVEIQDVEGMPIPGFRLEDCEELFGDSIAKRVNWEQGHDLSKLSGQTVRLRIRLRDADLYAIQFVE